jgi:hypothetical protein
MFVILTLNAPNVNRIWGDWGANEGKPFTSESEAKSAAKQNNLDRYIVVPIGSIKDYMDNR